MEQLRMVRRLLDLQRVGCDSVINNMILFWDQTSHLMNGLLEQAGWLPEESKKVLRDWACSNKSGCETLKASVDNGYCLLEKCFMGPHVNRDGQGS